MYTVLAFQDNNIYKQQKFIAQKSDDFYKRLLFVYRYMLPLLVIFFPARCIICNRHALYLCDLCLYKLEFYPPHCFYCQKSSLKGTTHTSCSRYISKVIVLVRYKSEIKKIITAFKYRKRYSYWIVIQKIIQDYIQRDIFLLFKNNFIDSTLHIFIPVPLSIDKFNKRGFWPTYIMANILKTVLKDEYSSSIYVIPNVLLKTRKTHSQARLNFNKRQVNLRNAFTFNNKKFKDILYKIRQKEQKQYSAIKIWIIDDVLSTGATINECAKTIQKATDKLSINWLKNQKISINAITLARG